jgi:hypothetical protein
MGLNAEKTKRYPGKFINATPQHLWGLKTGRIKPEPPNKATRRGTALEPWVLAETGRRMRLEVSEGHSFVKHPDWPRVRFQANTDGELQWKIPGLLECKTTAFSTYPASRGGTAQCFLKGWIPFSYAMQVQMYMKSKGYLWGIIADFVGPPTKKDYLPARYHEYVKEDGEWRVSDMMHFVMLSFRPNPRAVSIMEKGIRDFWECIEKDKEPDWEEHPLLYDLKRELSAAPCKVRPARPYIG